MSADSVIGLARLGKCGQVLAVNASAPYRSVAELLGGQIDLMITDTSTGVPQVKADKLRALGYSTQKRISQPPDVRWTKRA